MAAKAKEKNGKSADLPASPAYRVIGKLLVKELRSVLDSKFVNSRGSKAELIKRLNKMLKDEGRDPEKVLYGFDGTEVFEKEVDESPVNLSVTRSDADESMAQNETKDSTTALIDEKYAAFEAQLPEEKPEEVCDEKTAENNVEADTESGLSLPLFLDNEKTDNCKSETAAVDTQDKTPKKKSRSKRGRRGSNNKEATIADDEKKNANTRSASQNSSTSKKINAEWVMTSKDSLLWMTNLPLDITVSKILSHIESIGTVKRCKVMRKKSESGDSWADDVNEFVAYMLMSSPDEAKQCIEILQKAEISGQKIDVCIPNDEQIINITQIISGPAKKDLAPSETNSVSTKNENAVKKAPEYKLNTNKKTEIIKNPKPVEDDFWGSMCESSDKKKASPAKPNKKSNQKNQNIKKYEDNNKSWSGSTNNNDKSGRYFNMNNNGRNDFRNSYQYGQQRHKSPNRSSSPLIKPKCPPHHQDHAYGQPVSSRYEAKYDKKSSLLGDPVEKYDKNHKNSASLRDHRNDSDYRYPREHTRDQSNTHKGLLDSPEYHSSAKRSRYNSQSSHYADDGHRRRSRSREREHRSSRDGYSSSRDRKDHESSRRRRARSKSRSPHKKSSKDRRHHSSVDPNTVDMIKNLEKQVLSLQNQLNETKSDKSSLQPSEPLPPNYQNQLNGSYGLANSNGQNTYVPNASNFFQGGSNVPTNLYQDSHQSYQPYSNPISNPAAPQLNSSYTATKDFFNDPKPASANNSYTRHFADNEGSSRHHSSNFDPRINEKDHRSRQRLDSRDDFRSFSPENSSSTRNGKIPYQSFNPTRENNGNSNHDHRGRSPSPVNRESRRYNGYENERERDNYHQTPSRSKYTSPYSMQPSNCDRENRSPARLSEQNYMKPNNDRSDKYDLKPYSSSQQYRSGSQGFGHNSSTSVPVYSGHLSNNMWPSNLTQSPLLKVPKSDEQKGSSFGFQGISLNSKQNKNNPDSDKKHLMNIIGRYNDQPNRPKGFSSSPFK